MKRKTFRLVGGFKTLTPTRLRTRKNEVIEGLTNNPDFKDCEPSVKKLDDTGTEWDTACTAVEMGDKTQIEKRDALQVSVVNLLTKLLNQVNYITTDPELLSNTGFEIAKTPSKTPDVTAPKGLTAKDGNAPGMFKLRIKKVKGAKTYSWEWTTDPVTDNSQWESDQNAYVSYTVTGLVPGTKYWIRVAAIDKNGITVYCAPITRFAQQ